MQKLNITKVSNAAQAARAEERGETCAADQAGAEALAPWAAEVVEVEGGWIAFEDADEASRWASQR